IICVSNDSLADSSGKYAVIILRIVKSLPFTCETSFEDDASEDISQIRRYCSRRRTVHALAQRDPEALLHRIKRGTVDYLRIVRGVDQHAARTLFRGDPAEALAQPPMESVVEALEAVGG